MTPVTPHPHQETAAEAITETIEVGEMDFGVAVVYTPHEYYVDFFAAEIFAEDAVRDGVPLGRVYEARDGQSSMDWVTDPLKAFPFVRGSVKWDGCVNYEVGDQERVMMHACGPHDLAKLSRVLLHVYERCHRLMPKADYSPHA